MTPEYCDRPGCIGPAEMETRARGARVKLCRRCAAPIVAMLLDMGVKPRKLGEGR